MSPQVVSKKEAQQPNWGQGESDSSILSSLFWTLAELKHHHAPGSRIYSFLKQVAREEIGPLFCDEHPSPKNFGPFGELIFPFCRMGAVDSLNLFDLDELILFCFYWISRRKYRRVLDIGANIGLHSVVLSKCGFEVHAYEPDPKHYEILKRNLTLNGCARAEIFNVAVSSRTGEMEFVRVVGNTTSSHLAGAKSTPYGDLERFPVNVQAIGPLLKWADLIKLDAEGHEREILTATHSGDWSDTDALVEVGNEDNAKALYQHFTDLGVNMFSQKSNWNRVNGMVDMPVSYRDGTLFLTCKDFMNWNGESPSL